MQLEQIQRKPLHTEWYRPENPPLPQSIFAKKGGLWRLFVSSMPAEHKEPLTKTVLNYIYISLLSGSSVRAQKPKLVSRLLLRLADISVIGRAVLSEMILHSIYVPRGAKELSWDLQAQRQKAKVLLESIRSDDPFIQTLKAIRLLNGVGMPVDKPQALEILQNAADKDCALAQAHLGYCYHKGLKEEEAVLVVSDLEKARQLYQRAVDQQNALAMTYLGLLEQEFSNGAAAIAWYRQGAARGCGKAMLFLGYCYQDGIIIPKNVQIAADWYKKGAIAGDGDAMAAWGLCLHQSSLLNGANLEEACDWYKKGALAGSENAKVLFSIASLTVLSDDIYVQKAVTVLQEGAAFDNSLAKFYLGVCYLQGIGVVRDYDRAFELLEGEAQKGHPQAMMYLGRWYSEDANPKHSKDKAFTWFQAAARAGESLGMVHLGYCYLMGNGTTKNVKLAIQAFNEVMDEEGAEQSEAVALAKSCLGICHILGDGVLQNQLYGLALLKEGAQFGGNLFQKYLREVFASLGFVVKK